MFLECLDAVEKKSFVLKRAENFCEKIYVLASAYC